METGKKIVSLMGKACSTRGTTFSHSWENLRSLADILLYAVC